MKEFSSRKVPVPKMVGKVGNGLHLTSCYFSLNSSGSGDWSQHLIYWEAVFHLRCLKFFSSPVAYAVSADSSDPNGVTGSDCACRRNGSFLDVLSSAVSSESCWQENPPPP